MEFDICTAYSSVCNKEVYEEDYKSTVLKCIDGCYDNNYKSN